MFHLIAAGDCYSLPASHHHSFTAGHCHLNAQVTVTSLLHAIIVTQLQVTVTPLLLVIITSLLPCFIVKVACNGMYVHTSSFFSVEDMPFNDISCSAYFLYRKSVNFYICLAFYSKCAV